ncbi:hypothetical protein NHQ30_000028 [Ciborinia camelliae]|nr:hypothetical protein NHQ30_000028 [Ciborinia camelliae]
MAPDIGIKVSVQMNGQPLFRSSQLAISATRVRAIQSIIDQCASDIEYQLMRADADERRDAEHDRRLQDDLREQMRNREPEWDSRF